ncbi:MAG: nucleotidyl transferase AbiEii/AbiGii toxin family protein [Coriobacteriales bacterium]|nr:nucleotidyl transferase AbiEii/AbiGii toxin family protein [Coriobacteriales bacterium]
MQPLLPYCHDPYHGLTTLNPAHVAGLSLGDAIAQAEQELGCVPKGRLADLVMLFVTACMLQRLEDRQGEPLLVVKGGLVSQDLLGERARYTPDVDAALRCSTSEFLQRLPEAFSKPWGQVHATLGEIIESPYGWCPYEMLVVHVLLEADGCEPQDVTVDILCGPTAKNFSSRCSSVPALSGVGLPEPHTFWTITPEAVVTEKIAACVDVNVFDLDDKKLLPIHAARAKHLVDLVWLSRMCDAGILSNKKVVDEVEGLRRCSTPVREERGFQPLPRMMRIKVWEGWRFVYLGAALQTGLNITMDEAVQEVNGWLERIGL